MEDKEESYKLTEKGEAYAVDLIGGQDVANVLGCFQHILKTNGDAFGTKIEDEGEFLRNWLRLIPLLKIVKHCHSWDSLVVSCENVLEEQTDWFKSHPHSDFWDFRIERTKDNST